ncbi:MAG: hypothetical protein GX217_07555 [Clostridiaceae bacterium]|nr:hypothetical protein [Clostridiaceae bacterium]
MKKTFLFVTFFAICYGAFAQLPFGTYEPTPLQSSNNQIESDTEIIRVSGYVEDFQSVRKVSLKVAFKTDFYGNEKITVLELREKESGVFSGGDKWKTVNVPAYYCKGDCNFTFYARYLGGYIYFDY